MDKNEIKQALNKYKKFRLHYNSTNTNSVVFTLSELITELKLDYKFWKKIDDKEQIENGYSSRIVDLINRLNDLYEKEYIETDFGSEYNFYNTIMQRINKSTSSYLNFSSLNNYEILIRISFISRTNSKIDKLKIVYAKYFKENIDIYSKVLGLYCSSNNLSSYLNSRYNSPELKAALEFISLEVNNTNILKRRDAIDDKLDEFSDELDICKDKLELETLQLVNFSNDYKNEVDLWKNEKENWFLKKENEIKELKDMFNLRMQELEKIYNEKLRLEEPVKFWEKKANEKRWSFYFFLTATVILSIITLFIAASMIKDLYELSYTNEELRRFIPLSFMIIALVSFLIYLLRMSIKIMMSSKHLQTEYEQKATFTYFYLTLLNDSKTNGQIKDSEKNLIFQTLFSSPDTGLIKTSTNDSSDVMSLLTTIISKDNR